MQFYIHISPLFQVGIVPKIINDTDLSRIWYLQDNEFSVPKAIVNVELFR